MISALMIPENMKVIAIRMTENSKFSLETTEPSERTDYFNVSLNMNGWNQNWL